ncbi:hypothetical protein ACSBR1_031657 [Camellia fascicularis]
MAPIQHFLPHLPHLNQVYCRRQRNPPQRPILHTLFSPCHEQSIHSSSNFGFIRHNQALNISRSFDFDEFIPSLGLIFRPKSPINNGSIAAIFEGYWVAIDGQCVPIFQLHKQPTIRIARLCSVSGKEQRD